MSNLVVRVKRRRDQEPVQSLAVVEDLPTNKKKKPGLVENFGSLSTIQLAKRSAHVILEHVDTICEWNKHDIDTKTVSSSENAASKRKTNGDSTLNRQCLLRECGKKFLRASDSKSLVLVDVLQQYDQCDDLTSVHLTTGGKTTAIDTPANRRLEAAILDAFLKGDCSCLLFAIQQGADINYQYKDSLRRRPDLIGLTSLMCACKHGNVRFVKKLIVDGANVLLRTQKGRTAEDFGRDWSAPPAALENKVELLQWLHRSASKHAATLPTPLRELEQEDGEYVYDIYCYRDPSRESEIVEESRNFQGQVVVVGGIRIQNNAEGCDVELLFDYDSDWSDLADDESADSNDERYFGNDYPDDEDAESLLAEGRDADFGDDDVDEDWHDGIGGVAGNRHQRESDSSSDEDSDVEYRRDGPRSAWTEDCLMSNLRGLPRLREKNVGHVLRPSVLGGAGDVAVRGKEHLQQLWGEEGDGETVDSRLNDMHERSGLDFASDPREFDENGFPKCGFDLSDDDCIDTKENGVARDLMMSPEERQRHFGVQAHAGRWDPREKPDKNAIAFDPLLDCSD